MTGSGNRSPQVRGEHTVAWVCAIRSSLSRLHRDHHYSSLIPPGSRSERSTGSPPPHLSCRYAGVFISSFPRKEGRLCRSWPNRYLGFSWVLRLHRPTHNCFSAWEPGYRPQSKTSTQSNRAADHNVSEGPVRTIAFRSNRRAGLIAGPGTSEHSASLQHPSMSEQNKRSTNAEGVRLTVEPTAELIEARDRLPAVIAPAPSRIAATIEIASRSSGRTVNPCAGAGIGWLWWRHHQPQLPPGIAWGNGRLEADQIDIDTKFAGRIAQLFVDEGDMVRAGQAGREMDTRDLEASLKKSAGAGEPGAARARGGEGQLRAAEDPGDARPAGVRSHERPGAARLRHRRTARPASATDECAQSPR